MWINIDLLEGLLIARQVECCLEDALQINHEEVIGVIAWELIEDLDEEFVGYLLKFLRSSLVHTGTLLYQVSFLVHAQHKVTEFVEVFRVDLEPDLVDQIGQRLQELKLNLDGNLPAQRDSIICDALWRERTQHPQWMTLLDQLEQYHKLIRCQLTEELKNSVPSNLHGFEGSLHLLVKLLLRVDLRVDSVDQVSDLHNKKWGVHIIQALAREDSIVFKLIQP